ncbi:hypothetical protein DMUE_0914 [Dictyocoela muelleri]|nr:hypothetical protein DMUE_0914 [Dictyocoela muelleri]
MEKNHKLFMNDIKEDLSEMLSFYLKNPTHDRLLEMSETYDLSMISKMYIDSAEQHVYMKLIFMCILEKLNDSLKKNKNIKHLNIESANEKFVSFFYIFLLNQIYFRQSDGFVPIEINLDLLEEVTSFLEFTEYRGYLDDLKEVKAFIVQIDKQYRSYEIVNEISSEVDEIEMILDKELI